MHLSPFFPSVIFGTIPKSLKMVPWTPCALWKHVIFCRFFLSVKPLWKSVHLWKEHFFFFFFSSFFIVRQTPLKSMHLLLFVTSVIFGTIPKSLKIVPWKPHTLMKMSFFSAFFFPSNPSEKVYTFERNTFFSSFFFFFYSPSNPSEKYAPFTIWPICYFRNDT